MVRVVGYSAYFTRLPRPFQDAIINRTEHRFLQEYLKGNGGKDLAAQC